MIWVGYIIFGMYPPTVANGVAQHHPYTHRKPLRFSFSGFADILGSPCDKAIGLAR